MSATDPQKPVEAEKPAEAEANASPISEFPEPLTKRFTWRGKPGGKGRAVSIDYDATTEFIPVHDDDGTYQGSMFAISYLVADDEATPSGTDTAKIQNPAPRPVSFCYNGGPGCGTFPLNVGGIGPWRCKTENQDYLTSPAQIMDNPCTPLPFSDLVFLDAPGTGWSKVAPGYDAKKLWSIDGDADAFARAIETWLTKHKRWNSPVYLFGESYGTLRDCVLARLLSERDVALAGVVLMSTVLDWCQMMPGEELYYLGYLPTWAACAHHHGKAGEGVSLEDWFQQAVDFTDNTLVAAIMLGDNLPPEREREVAEEMSRFIGVSVDFILERHLRIELDDYRRELLKDEGKVLGRFDMSFAGPAPSTTLRSSGWFENEDAAADALEPSWMSCYRKQLGEIGFMPEERYIAVNWEAGMEWDYGHKCPGIDDPLAAPNVTFDLGIAMKHNPNMKVAIIAGRFDGATPYWNVRHVFSTQFLPKRLKDNIRWLMYDCGHMSYVEDSALEGLTRDLAEFYKA